MAERIIDDNLCTLMANAIRGKGVVGGIEYKTNGFADAIASIPSASEYEWDSVEIVPFATGTDAQILSMIQTDHEGKYDLRDFWHVGDTRTVQLSSMEAEGVSEAHEAQEVTLVLMDSTCQGFTWAETPLSGETTPHFIIGQLDCLKEKGEMNATNTVGGGWRDCIRRTWLNNVYRNALPSTVKSWFNQFKWKQGDGTKSQSSLFETTDYLGFAPEYAVLGSGSTYSSSGERVLYTQWEWYQTSSNRIKQVDGVDARWWECSPNADGNQWFCNVSVTGTAYGGGTPSTGQGISPFGCI